MMRYILLFLLSVVLLGGCAIGGQYGGEGNYFPRSPSREEVPWQVNERVRKDYDFRESHGYYGRGYGSYGYRERYEENYEFDAYRSWGQEKKTQRLKKKYNVPD